MRTPIICSVCGTDRFFTARKIAKLQLLDETFIREWLSSPEDASEIQCARCDTVFVWNSVTNNYQQATTPPMKKQ